MATSEATLKEFHQDTIRLCADILAGSPNPEAAIKSPRQLADERLAKVRDTLEKGFDRGGIVKDIVPVNELRNEPYVGWVYVTPDGLYMVSWRA